MAVFTFENLDNRARRLMVREFERDREQGVAFIDARLRTKQAEGYLQALRNALERGTPEGLGEEIERNAYLRSTEIRDVNGRGSEARIPRTYPQTLAEAEFNRYYMRAICLIAVEERKAIEVYRAKEVVNPRPVTGQIWTPDALLAHLRTTNISVEGAFPGANSGKSVRLVG